MPDYKITHRTTYRYKYPVSISHHSAFLHPRNAPGQTCHSFQLDTFPKATEIRERTDFFGNVWHLFSLQESHQQLIVSTQSQVSVSRQSPQFWTLPATPDRLAEKLASQPDPIALVPFQYPSPRVPDFLPIREFAAPFFASGKSLAESAYELAVHLKQHFQFDPSATDEKTPVQEFFQSRRGVCQDFTHLMLACLRNLRIPARYVSGYILTQPPPGQPRLEGADASHAWVSLYIPDFGWLDLDPTNGLVVGDQHVAVAWGRDFSDISMIRGAVTGGGEQKLKIEVTMKPMVD